MIKPKTGVCIDCPPGSPVRYLTAGRCQPHYWQHRRVVSTSNSKDRDRKNPEERKALGLYYDYHNLHNEWICENCGTELFTINNFIMSSCQAHIIPKEHFKSVQGCLENHLTLGGFEQSCYCHKDYDSSWKKAQGMTVFSLATERFIKFKHLIRPQEIKHLPDVFYKIL